MEGIANRIIAIQLQSAIDDENLLKTWFSSEYFNLQLGRKMSLQ